MHTGFKIVQWFLLAWLAFYEVVAQSSLQVKPKIENTIYLDIFLQETPQTWEFGNSQLIIEVNKNTGAWTGLSAKTVLGKLIQAQQLAQTVDFKIDTTWMVEKHNATLLK